MDSLLDSGPQKEFRRLLLQWYRKHGRHDMPWRKTTDPYAVIVSEFMLQQTTVATVLPYYDRFLKRFPTLQSLADADLNDVLALWSGLGYYARARNLWASMKAVATEHAGKIPQTPEALEELPGIGPYTAGAIASFGFNQPGAVLDGNVIRVLMRVLAIEDDPKMKASQTILKKVSLDLCALSPKDPKAAGGPRDLNLALMDLGATLCSPQDPQCHACPVSTLCLARAYGKQEDIPMKAEKLDRPTVRKLHAVIEWNGHWLMGQRPEKGLFGGLWEFPGVDTAPGIEPVVQLEHEISRDIGFPIRVKRALPTFDHHLTHRVFTVRAFVCEPHPLEKMALAQAKSGNHTSFRWVLPGELIKMGISAITKRIVQLNG